MRENKKHIETDVIHGGYDSKEHNESLSPPIYQTSTFSFETAEQGEAFFSNKETGYIYSRLGNPTVTILQDRIAMLENGEAGLAFASGMGAVSAVFMSLTESGDHILCSKGVYGCTFGLLELFKSKYNISYVFCDMSTEERIRASITPRTTCIFIETPINPTMQLVDLKKVVKIARENRIPVVVDNTFCSPYLQKPIALGCDVVIHSATKYLGGHGDLIAGLVVGKEEYITQLKTTVQKDVGAILSPFDAWLLIRGIKTLAIRMERHCENAVWIAEKLKNHPKVKSVYYPGDVDNSQYELASRQMRKPGGIISFTVKGTKEHVKIFLNELKMIKIAVSLGDPETLIQHPATMTHSLIPKESREQMGITDTLVRLSVGLEKKEDIWEDLNEALSKI